METFTHEDFEHGFTGFDDSINTEENERLENCKYTLGFGVPFLDESLLGIMKNDLVLIGAKSGLGKTQIATIIAKHNALAGKRVYFIALEAENNEITRRIKFQNIADEYFKQPLDKRNIYNFNYMDWYTGKYRGKIDEVEKRVCKELSIPNLKVYYRKETDFTVKNLEETYLRIRDRADLIIIDHLNYFDMETENENREIKMILKKIRDLCLVGGVPVILVAHVRKTNKFLKQLMPDLEDFHGSSDIGKIATKAVMIAPDTETQINKTQSSTYINVLKNRIDGSRRSYVARVAFDFTKQTYLKDYQLGRIAKNQEDFLDLEDDNIPHWANSAIRSRKPDEKKASWRDRVYV